MPAQAIERSGADRGRQVKHGTIDRLAHGEPGKIYTEQDMTLNQEQSLRETRRYWDNAATTFDDEPDHGLRDPVVRNAWTSSLARWLPETSGQVLDIGCGTGSLSLLLAHRGHTVIGVDLSPAMIAQAEAKARAAGAQITFQVMDAAHPQFPPHHFAAIVCRHLLWTLPDPPAVLQRWADLLTPGGRLVLVEGFWNTGAGIQATAVVEAMAASFTNITLEPLSDQPELWGGQVSDERYAITAVRS
jgi:SAM-dependent methyltransferase